MDFIREFKKAFRPGTRWLRTNYVNPKAREPVEITVIKTTPKEAVVQLPSGDGAYLEWPKAPMMNAAPVEGGWHLKDEKGRTILSYMPLEEQPQIKNVAESIVDSLLEEKENPDAWIGVDFDGTLATHTEYKGPKSLGEIIPKMAARVRRWVGHGKKVKIFTARADDELSVNAIKKWLKDNELPDLPITNLKDKDMIEIWDDKAISVKKNTGEVKESAVILRDCIFEDGDENWEPSPHVLNWFQNLLRHLQPKAQWVVPATGQVYEIDKAARKVTLVSGDPNDEEQWHQKTKKTFEILGYTMHDHPPENPDEMAFAESRSQHLS